MTNKRSYQIFRKYVSLMDTDRIEHLIQTLSEKLEIGMTVHRGLYTAVELDNIQKALNAYQDEIAERIILGEIDD